MLPSRAKRQVIAQTTVDRPGWVDLNRCDRPYARHSGFRDSGIAGNLILEDGEVDATAVVCNGADGFASLVLIDDLVGTACDAYGNGGQRLRSGLDDGLPSGTAGDLVLDDGEVESTVYVCNGADGTDGHDTIIEVVAEPAGVTCPYGGQIVTVWLDLDGDGEFDDSVEEATSTALCNGADGVDGASVAVEMLDEAPGDNCVAGGVAIVFWVDLDGDGELDGDETANTAYLCRNVALLVDLTDEEPGENCPDGGQRVDIGWDTDADEVLDESEIAETHYLCHGTDGASGASSLVDVSDEPAGENCADGGRRVDVGLDGDGDGVLDQTEIELTTFLCDDAAALVETTTEPAGANCPYGGQRVDIGHDADGSGALDPSEIEDTEFICNGAISLVVVSEEPPGENCPSGGKRVEVGLDLSGDGTLDDAEVSETTYLCVVPADSGSGSPDEGGCSTAHRGAEPAGRLGLVLLAGASLLAALRRRRRT